MKTVKLKEIPIDRVSIIMKNDVLGDRCEPIYKLPLKKERGNNLQKQFSMEINTLALSLTLKMASVKKHRR